jgi:transposase
MMWKQSGRSAKNSLSGRLSMMKSRKGSGRSIVAIARKLSTIVCHMLTNDEEFDPGRMTNLGVHQTAKEMQAAAFDAE